MMRQFYSQLAALLVGAGLATMIVLPENDPHTMVGAAPLVIGVVLWFALLFTEFAEE